MRPGELFTSCHRPELLVNHLTAPIRDPLTTAVRLERRRTGT